LRGEGLAPAAMLSAAPDDPVPEGTRTLALISPREPAFWPHVRETAEFQDGLPDPLDRWSRRVIGAVAARFGAVPLFPFSGPPYLPFQAWALRSGRIWCSPTGLLVSHGSGLYVSFRAALALPWALTGRSGRASPCETCVSRPCLGACPVGALSDAAPYDVPACHAHLATPAGGDCLDQGCAVSRACPHSARACRDPGQSAFHMRAFHS
jgi:hypothetical protein